MSDTRFKLEFVAALCGVLIMAAPCAQSATPVQTRPAPEAAPFDVMEYQVAGNTLLDALTIERAVYPHLGEGKGLPAVEQARASLEKTYHDAGYLTVMVDIPEQQVQGGVVQLRITESRIEKVRVTGARYYSQGRIREQVPGLAQDSIPNFNEVQQQFGKLARTADRRVTPVLRPGKTPGKVEVELKVQDKLPLHGSLELNDRYSTNTTHTRLNGMLRYDNLWQREHSLAVNFQIAPENTDDAQVLSATYVFPDRSGWLYAAYAVRSRSKVAAAGDINVLGDADLYGLRAIIPLASSPEAVHTLSLGADYKDLQEAILFGSDTLSTPISYAPFTVQYSATLREAKSTTQYGVSANFSIRGLADENIDCGGGEIQNEFTCKRFGAKPDYFFLRGNVSRTQQFPGKTSLVAAANAQLSGQPLISSEQFSAGGVDSVRGYLESEALGDSALRAALELHGPSFAAGHFSDLHLLAFVDGAALRVQEALPGQENSYTLAAAGVGVRARMNRFLLGALDLAQPLRDGTTTEQGDTRLHFRLTSEF